MIITILFILLAVAILFLTRNYIINIIIVNIIGEQEFYTYMYNLNDRIRNNYEGKLVTSSNHKNIERYITKIKELKDMNNKIKVLLNNGTR